MTASRRLGILQDRITGLYFFDRFRLNDSEESSFRFHLNKVGSEDEDGQFES